MKWMIAIALFAAAGFLSAQGASAQTSHLGHYQPVQYAVPPVAVMTVCNINGVYYQVDYSYRIWAVNAYGVWFVLGQIVTTPYGPVGLRNDGVRFPAVCA